MRQMKPPSHYLMQVSLRRSADGRAYFKDPAATATITEALSRGARVASPRKLSRAIDEISIACTRYARSNDYWREIVPRDEQVVHTKKLRDAATKTMTAIESIDRRSWQRLILLLGEDGRRKSRRKLSRTPLQRQEQRIDRGYERLNSIFADLFFLGEVTAEALEAIPRDRGRPAERTPLLERSLLHELADIWCGFHGKPYVAPNITLSDANSNNARPNQYGARFVETVMILAGIDLSKMSFVQMSKAVRRERINEWKAQRSSDAQRVKAQRELNAGMPTFVRRRETAKS